MAKKPRPVLFNPTVFNVFKPAGMTSFDVIRVFKRSLPRGFGKIGHFGTLDPFASGVLLIGVAGAAKISDVVHFGLPKTYIATMKLGIKTLSCDITTEVVERKSPTKELLNLSREKIDSILKDKFIGEYLQSPQYFSAAKYNGKPLYEYARRGEFIKKEKVLRTIYDLSVIKFSPPYISIRFVVSSGTYIRNLFEDCMLYFDSIGTLISLTRTSIGDISSSYSIHRGEWPPSEKFNILTSGMALDDIIKYSSIVLTTVGLNKFAHGQDITSYFKDFKYYKFPCWIKNSDGEIAGLVIRENGAIKSKINFSNVTAKYL